MGMGGGGQKSTTQETKEIRLPPWVEAASQGNYQFAEDIAGRPYQAYGGKTLAPLNSDFYTARERVGSLDDYFGDYKDASGALKGILNYNPEDISQRAVTAPTMKDANISTYLNPYIGEVESNAIREMAAQGTRDQRRIASDATKSGGLGGSRQGVQQAVQGAKTVQAIGDTSASLRKQGYDTATQLAQKDLERQYQAAVQTGNWQQEAEIRSRMQDLEAHGQTIAGAKQLQENADAAQAASMNDITARLGFAQMMQEQKQREYDQAAAKWQKKYDYPLEQLNLRLAALGMSPYGHTESGTSTTRSEGGGGGGGLMGMLGMGSKLISGLMGLSDPDAKTNIEPAGNVGGTPMYAYDYKADVKAAKKAGKPMPPKRVGPMAGKNAPRLGKSGRRVIDLTQVA